MSLWSKERCVSCSAEGRFPTLSKHGVCSRCQSAFRTELDAHMRELPKMERRFQQLKTAAKQLPLAAEMVTRLERVMAVEQLGIYSNVESEVLLPSQWLSQYRSEHDWALVHIVSDKFDALWDDLFHKPKSPATLRKLQHVKALADEARPKMYDTEKISPLHQRIDKKLQEITAQNAARNV